MGYVSLWEVMVQWKMAVTIGDTSIFDIPPWVLGRKGIPEGCFHPALESELVTGGILGVPTSRGAITQEMQDGLFWLNRRKNSVLFIEVDIWGGGVI